MIKRWQIGTSAFLEPACIGMSLPSGKHYDSKNINNHPWADGILEAICYVKFLCVREEAIF